MLDMKLAYNIIIITLNPTYNTESNTFLNFPTNVPYGRGGLTLKAALIYFEVVVKRRVN